MYSISFHLIPGYIWIYLDISGYIILLWAAASESLDVDTTSTPTTCKWREHNFMEARTVCNIKRKNTALSRVLTKAKQRYHNHITITHGQQNQKFGSCSNACTEENTWLSHDSIISKIRRSQCTSWLSNAQVKSFFGSNLRLASPRRSLTSQSLKWAKFCIRHTLTYTDIPWDTPQICIDSVFLDITKGLHHNSVCSLLNEDTQGLMENCFGIFARGRRPQGLVQSNPKWNKIHLKISLEETGRI